MGLLQQKGITNLGGGSTSTGSGLLQRVGVSSLQQSAKTASTPTITASPTSTQKKIGSVTVKLVQPKQTEVKQSQTQSTGKITLAPNQKRLNTNQLDQLSNREKSSSATLTQKAKMTTPEQKKINLEQSATQLKKDLPYTSQVVSDIAGDFTNKKTVKQQQTENRKVAVQAWNDLKTSMAEYYKKGILSEQKVSPKEKIIRKAETVVAGAKVATTAISGVFQIASKIPVVGTVVKAMGIPFTLLEDSKVASKTSNAIVDNLPVSKATKERIRPVMTDAISIASQVALGHMLNVAGKKANGVIKNVGADTFERFTKNIIEEQGGSRVVNFTPKDVRDINLGKTVYEADLIKQLKLTSSQWRDAVQNGVSVSVPAERIVRIMDKPYWEKIKSVFKIEATDQVKSLGRDTPTTRGGIVGYLPSGEATPAQVIGSVMQAGKENTAEGKAFIKLALEAQSKGQNVQIGEPTLENPLIAEARKYKSAEKWFSGSDTPTPSGRYTYLTTDRNYASEFGKNINEYQFKPSNPVDFTSFGQKPITFKKLQSFLQENGVKIDKSMVDENYISGVSEPAWFWLRRYQNIVDEVAKTGKDSILLKESIGGKGVKDSAIVLNKSQLTDIWNKANKGAKNVEIPQIEKAGRYASASDYADMVFGTTPDKQIGLLDPNTIVIRDPVGTGTPEYEKLKEDIQKNGIKEPIRIDASKEPITVDGSQRTAIAKELGIKVPVIVNKGEIPGLSTIEEIYNRQTGVDETLANSDQAREAENQMTPHKEKVAEKIKTIEEDLSMRRQENEAKQSILDQFNSDQIKAMRTIKQAMLNREEKGRDAITVEELPTYKKNIADVMSAIGTDSTDEALRYIREDLPDPIINASSRAELAQIKVLKSHLTPKEVTVPRSQLPAGSGKEKVSKLEARMKTALEGLTKDKIDEIGLTTYREMNRKETIKKAAQYVIENPNDAIKILQGTLEAPPGIPRNAIMIAMMQEAVGDANLAVKLASLQSTRYGQELNILKELDPNNPVKLINEVIRFREQEYQRRYKMKPIEQVKEKVVREIRDKVKKPDKYDWNHFLNSIEC